MKRLIKGLTQIVAYWMAAMTVIGCLAFFETNQMTAAVIAAHFVA